MGGKRDLSLFITVFSIVLVEYPVRAQFNYFQMVQQWPPAYCRTGPNCRQPVPNMFTIHGLWPNNLIFCNNASVLTRAQISTMITDLNTHWPNLIAGGINFNFWRNQWKKHGTCSLALYNQTQYFQLALNIKMNRNYDIYHILNQSRLAPTATGSSNVTAAQIQNAIQHSSIGTLPGVRCTNISGTTPPQRIINEIVLCFQPNGTIQNCPAAITNCGPQPRPWLLAPEKTSTFKGFFFGAQNDYHFLRRASGVSILIFIVYFTRKRLLKIFNYRKTSEVDPKKDD